MIKLEREIDGKQKSCCTQDDGRQKIRTVDLAVIHPDGSGCLFDLKEIQGQEQYRQQKCQENGKEEIRIIHSCMKKKLIRSNADRLHVFICL